MIFCLWFTNSDSKGFLHFHTKHILITRNWNQKVKPTYLWGFEVYPSALPAPISSGSWCKLFHCWATPISRRACWKEEKGQISNCEDAWYADIQELICDNMCCQADCCIWIRQPFHYIAPATIKAALLELFWTRRSCVFVSGRTLMTSRLGQGTLTQLILIRMSLTGLSTSWVLPLTCVMHAVQFTRVYVGRNCRVWWIMQ